MTAITDEPGYGRYELLAKIGEGPRGPVFVARIRGDAVAEPSYVVELNAFATGEEESQRTFHHDLARVAQLRHQNVLGVLETGTTAAGDYVVMDYVEGATLSEIQERHRAIRPPRLVLATVIDALCGLHAGHMLHADGGEPLLHGSVSPDHLLIGTDGVCRITGFGNVRPRVQTKPSHRTRTTVGYMAPEQLTGAAVDHRADVFSIGVVLWNALTGKKLFHDRIEHLTMSNVLDRKVPRPSSIGLSPPPVLDAIVLKALERDPGRRFQNAAELADTLRDVARGAACLAAASEVGEWITTTFGGELAARRREIREPGQRPRRGTAVSVLSRSGPPAPDAFTRDELSLDELARATDPPPRSLDSVLGPAPTTNAAPVATPPSPARRQVALVAIAAFTVVALVLGWRWSVASASEPDPAPRVLPAASAPSSVELEVTVLEVRNVVATVVAPPRVVPPSRIVAQPSVEPQSRRPAVAPSRPPARSKRPARAQPAPRPASTDDRPEAPEVRPAEPRPEPTPPAPARPTLEANPYLYK